VHCKVSCFPSLPAHPIPNTRDHHDDSLLTDMCD
jgi:hypothetical protein